MLAQKCNAGRTVQQHLQICSCGERSVCVCEGVWVWVVGWVTTTEIMKTTTNRNPHLCMVHSLIYYPTTQHWLWLCCALQLSLPAALFLCLLSALRCARSLLHSLNCASLSLALVHLLRLQFFVNFRFTSHT